MINFIRNLLWHLKSTATKRREEGASMDQGFHDLPTPRARAGMTPEQLAILLSGCAKDSPQFILVSHELNVRIAKVQSHAAYGAALFGLCGVVLGAFLAASLQQQQPEVKGKDEGRHVGENQGHRDPPVPLQRAVNQSAGAKVDTPAKAERQANGESKP